MSDNYASSQAQCDEYYNTFSRFKTFLGIKSIVEEKIYNEFKSHA